MVRPEGFEPPTNGFGSHYSIRLSYERVVSCSPGRRCWPPNAVVARESILAVNAAQVCPPFNCPARQRSRRGLAVSFAHGLRTF